ncbi:hypothetical protein [Methylomonas sp. AM2-LC]|uniref:hypothetical protein n=1 Tax=Methylomonas sp. AM2-LC TaxID=3153301 RepID=UPI003267D507
MINMLNTICLRLLLVMFLIVISGCTVNSYQGVTRPDSEVATVILKKPIVAMIPLFWVFPFNMLTWQYDDWYETSWSDKDILINSESLNRFKTVKVLPGKNSIESIVTRQLADQTVGASNCSNGPCSCTKDKDNKENCTFTESCSTPHEITEQIEHCLLYFTAVAGTTYQVFIHNGQLTLSNFEQNKAEIANCVLGDVYKRQTYESTSNTLSCSK